MPLDKNSTFYDSERNYTHFTEAFFFRSFNINWAFNRGLSSNNLKIQT